MTFSSVLRAGIAAIALITTPALAAPPSDGKADEGTKKKTTSVFLEVVKVGGSSTVAPFVSEIGYRLRHDMQLKVRPTGSTDGLIALCSDDGREFGLVGASRPIRENELESCHQNGIAELLEMVIGEDAVVLAQGEKVKPIELTPRDIYIALARSVPDSDQQCVMRINRRRTWSDVRADLPKREISVIGPSTTSGTRDMFRELILRAGARSFSCLAALEERSPAFFEAALDIRSDGAWVDGGENDHAISYALNYIPEAIGVFGYAHLREADKVQPIALTGVEPSYDTIASGTYGASRRLYLYVRKSDYKQSKLIEKVLRKFRAPESLYENGYLRERGLIISEDSGSVRTIDTGSKRRKSSVPTQSVMTLEATASTEK